MSMSKLTPADFIGKNSENVERTKDGAEGSSKITVNKKIFTFFYFFHLLIFFLF